MDAAILPLTRKPLPIESSNGEVDSRIDMKNDAAMQRG
jgi:hypothetical protein